MALQNLVVFPLHSIVDGKCGCGREDCGRVGKHAVVNWGDLKLGDPVPRPAPGAGYGIKTGAAPKGSGFIVVDLDGPDAVAAWEALGGSDNTYTVASPRAEGGLHLYFPHEGFPIGNSVGRVAKGIDIRGDGGMVVGPGSPHKSGGTYEVIQDIAPAPMPEWLRAWFKSRPAPTETQDYPGDVTDRSERERRRDLYTKYLRDDAPPCVAGQRGDVVLFEVVQRGAYDLALPVDDVLELMTEHYDPRCDPPWGEALEERVVHKAHTAKTASQRPRLEPLSIEEEALFDDIARDYADGAYDGAGAPDVDFSEAVATAAASLGANAEGPPDAGLPIIWGKWDEPSVPPVYLLDGLIPEGKVCCFFAEGGSVKTWAVLALGIAVATGQPWLDTYGVKPGRVLIADFEDGREEFKRRKRILTQHESDIPSLGYMYGHVQLTDVKAWKAFASLGLTLLIIDALASGMPADADENHPMFAAAVKLAGKFTEATGCTVVFIHHANKTGGLRGTSAIRDQCDVVFRFEPVDESADRKRMCMVCDKPGPQKKPLPVNLELTDAGLRTFEFTPKEDPQQEIPEAVDDRVIAYLEHPARDGLYVGSQESFAKAVGGNIPSTRARIKDLLGAGRIARRENEGGQTYFELETEQRRIERVKASIQTCQTWASATKLGDASFVPRRFVETLLASGIIVKSQDGRWSVVSR
jgi:hypothetical protein